MWRLESDSGQYSRPQESEDSLLFPMSDQRVDIRTGTKSGEQFSAAWRPSDSAAYRRLLPARAHLQTQLTDGWAGWPTAKVPARRQFLLCFWCRCVFVCSVLLKSNIWNAAPFDFAENEKWFSWDSDCMKRLSTLFFVSFLVGKIPRFWQSEVWWEMLCIKLSDFTHWLG